MQTEATFMLTVNQCGCLMTSAFSHLYQNHKCAQTVQTEREWSITGSFYKHPHFLMFFWLIRDLPAPSTVRLCLVPTWIQSTIIIIIIIIWTLGWRKYLPGWLVAKTVYCNINKWREIDICVVFLMNIKHRRATGWGTVWRGSWPFAYKLDIRETWPHYTLELEWL